MPNYICRWPNGDLSLVNATDKSHAIFLLDEVGGAAPTYLRVTKAPFMVHFSLNDLFGVCLNRARNPGAPPDTPHQLHLDLFGQELAMEISEREYPVMDALDADASDDDIITAVKAERERVTT